LPLRENASNSPACYLLPTAYFWAQALPIFSDSGARHLKKLLALIVLVVPLLIGHTTVGEELMVGEDLRHERILLPPAAPDRSRMVIRDTMMFVEEGNGAGIFVFYDDPRTKTDVDYIEMYDVDGGLLLVAWIDRFGICQVAMDRGLLDSAHPALDGTFVMVDVGVAL
jgi:hypothetical protein